MTGYADAPTGSLPTWVAAATVAVLGCGLALALAGAGSGASALVVLGGAAAGAALVLLLAAGTLEALPILVLSLPLPALYATSQLRIAPAAVTTLAVVGAWFIAWAPSGRRLRLPVAVRLPILAFLGTILLSSAFAQHHGAALRELVSWGLLLGLLMVATDLFAERPRRIHRAALVLAVVLGMAGVAATMQAVGILPSPFSMAGTPFQRATLGFGWPNELAMFLAVGVPFSVYALRVAARPGARLLAAFGLAAALMGLLATFSRASWLGLIAATGALLLVGARRLALRTFLFGGALVAALDLAVGGTVSARAASLVDDPFVLQRAGLQLTGLLMFREHPLVGVGPGGFAHSLESFAPQVSWLFDYVGTAHNVYIDMAAETGILGLAAFLWVTVAGFRLLLGVARRPSGVEGRGAEEDVALRQTLFWSFATASFVGFAGWPFAHGVGQLIMLVLAAGLALNTIRDPGPEGGEPGEPRTTEVGGVSLLPLPVAGGSAS